MTDRQPKPEFMERAQAIEDGSFWIGEPLDYDGDCALDRRLSYIIALALENEHAAGKREAEQTLLDILQAHEGEKRILYSALERALSHFMVMGTDEAASAALEIEEVLSSHPPTAISNAPADQEGEKPESSARSAWRPVTMCSSCSGIAEDYKGEPCPRCGSLNVYCSTPPKSRLAKGFASSSPARSAAVEELVRAAEELLASPDIGDVSNAYLDPETIAAERRVRTALSALRAQSEGVGR